MDLLLDSVLEKYREETKVPASLEELKQGVSRFQPLVNSSGVVGVFGYDIVPSSVFGEVAVVKLLYMLPEHRKTFKPVVVSILQTLVAQGYERVEFHVTHKIHNWLRKHLNSRPDTYVHFGDTKKFLGQLEGRQDGI